MQFTAFNGSPRGKSGHTAMMLNELRKGIEKAGANLEVINLIDYKIDLCKACFSCWNRHVGKCVIQDDMSILREKIKQSDVIILGSPVYYDNVTSIMKVFIERFLPFHTAKLVVGVDQKYKHDIIESMPKIVMMSSCDLPDFSNFDVISVFGKKIAKNLDAELIGEIYRSEARLFRFNSPIVVPIMDEYKKVWVRAGYELATNGTLSDQTKNDIRRPIVTYTSYVKMANTQGEEGSQVYY